MTIMIKGNAGYFGFKLAALASDIVSVMNTAHWKFMSSSKLHRKVDIDLPDDTTSYTTWIESSSPTLQVCQVSQYSLLADFHIF